jgi:hypothetical protein
VKDAENTRKQVRADAVVRNQIEGKFGQGKRRFSLGRVMAKLVPTAECTIAITFLVMNVERWLQHFLFVFFAVVFWLQHGFELHRTQYQNWSNGNWRSHKRMKITDCCDSAFYRMTFSVSPIYKLCSLPRRSHRIAHPIFH